MADKITVSVITEIPIYEGRKNRNSYSIEVTVDGATYKVHMRRETSSIKLPAELKDHPLASEIKTAAGKAVIDKLMPGIEAAHQATRKPRT